MTIDAFDLIETLAGAYARALHQKLKPGQTRQPVQEHQVLQNHPSYRGYFNFRSRGHLEATSAAAATLLASMQADIKHRRIRLGLTGQKFTGKSILGGKIITGLGAERMPDKSALATHIPSAHGLILYYDTGANMSKDLTEIGTEEILGKEITEPGIDIFEHPQDALNPQFDLVFNIEAQGDGNRYITVLADDEVAALPAFIAFQNALQEYKMP